MPPTPLDPLHLDPGADGAFGPRHAEIVVGEGPDRIALRVTAMPHSVRVRARLGTSEAAEAVLAGAPELRDALRLHGLELAELATDVLPGDRQNQPEQDAPQDDANHDFDEDVPTIKDPRRVVI